MRCEITDMKGGHTSDMLCYCWRSSHDSHLRQGNLGYWYTGGEYAGRRAEAVAGDPEAELVGPMPRSFTDEEGNFVIVGVERDKSYALNATFMDTAPAQWISIPLKLTTWTPLTCCSSLLK